MATVFESAGPNLPTYGPYQQIICLNAASNAAALKKGKVSDLEAGIKKTLDKVLPELTPKGQWKTAWGPAVYSLSTGVVAPLNAWYVAQNDKDQRLVVAIAGTAKASGPAWVNDCLVHQVVRWDDWVSTWTPTNVPNPTNTLQKSGPLVSRGTCNLVRNILNKASPATGAAPGKYLGQFLKDFQTSNPTYSITFTGHSLGGAVSPALAVGLAQKGIINNKLIYAEPSAGASPGNSTFNERFTKYFPDGRNLYNKLDIVPQAWSLIKTEDRYIDKINEMYEKGANDLKQTLKTSTQMASTASRTGTQYIGLPGNSFTANTGIPDGLTWAGFRDTVAPYQHTDAYWEYLKIEDFIKFFKDVLKDFNVADNEVMIEDFEISDDSLGSTKVDESNQ